MKIKIKNNALNEKEFMLSVCVVGSRLCSALPSKRGRKKIGRAAFYIGAYYRGVRDFNSSIPQSAAHDYNEIRLHDFASVNL